MTAQELINNYLEARQNLSKAMATIKENEDVLKQDFQMKYPEYYIKHIFTIEGIVTAAVHNVSNNEIVSAFAHLSFDGNWKW